MIQKPFTHPRYPDPLAYSPTGEFSWGRPKHILLEPFTFDSEILGTITAPAGFVTDGASVPRIAWVIVPPFGRYTNAAVIHDYLYHHYVTDKKTRLLADDVFLEGMEVLGVPRWKRRMMYRAVRSFGWASHWSIVKKVRNEQAKKNFPKR